MCIYCSSDFLCLCKVHINYQFSQKWIIAQKNVTLTWSWLLWWWKHTYM